MPFGKIARTFASLYYAKTCRQVEDPFIYRVKQTVPGMLQPGNTWSFQYAVQYMPADTAIMEIGAFCGLSTCLISYFNRQRLYPSPFFTCDPWDYGFKGMGTDTLGASKLTGKDWEQFCKATFLKNIDFWCEGQKPRVLQMPSTAVCQALTADEAVTDTDGKTEKLPNALGFVYIDGNHDYDPVKADFLGVEPFVVKDGYILFDDSADVIGSPGVKEFIAKDLKPKFIETGRYKVIARNPNLLIQKI
jgi:hypothetical protein